MSIRTTTQTVLNHALRPLNVQIIKGRSTDPAVPGYLSARKTLAAASAAGQSVGDFIDTTFATPGTTARTVIDMLELAGLTSARRVCEIGPGTGRYSEKVIGALTPEAYEIYEPATDWLPHLRRLPGTVVRPCDGHTLRHTETGSVDLVHAQKVFVYLPFEAMIGYLDEMVRVTRPGGAIAFDVITERCLSDDLVARWTAAGTIYRPVPREWLIDHLTHHGGRFAGSRLVPLVDGQTELLVFHRDGGDSPGETSP